VIVGGGIGGLSAAVALLAAGLRVEVYEQARQLGEVGAGVGLHQNSQRVLRRLGLREEINRVAARISGFRVCRPDGSVVSSETYGPDAPHLGVHRADLVALLAAALPQGVVHTGRRCTQFVQDARSATAVFDTGDIVEADVVIAADGIHSVLQQYVERTEPVFSGTVAYRGIVSAARVPNWPQSLVVWGGDGKHLLTFPVRAGRQINFVGFVPADAEMRESWSAPGDPAVLAAEFGDWTPQVRRILEQVDTTFKWGLYDRNPLSRWTNGRLALLGDAAHAMLPHMGQGAKPSHRRCDGTGHTAPGNLRRRRAGRPRSLPAVAARPHSPNPATIPVERCRLRCRVHRQPHPAMGSELRRRSLRARCSSRNDESGSAETRPG